MNEPRPCYFGRWVPAPDDRSLLSPLRRQLAVVPDLLRDDVVLRRSTERDVTDAQEWAGRLDAVAARLPYRKRLGEMAQRVDARCSVDLDDMLVSTREALTTGLRGSVTPDAADELKRCEQMGSQGASAMLVVRHATLIG
jgi:hypothetical protein